MKKFFYLFASLAVLASCASKGDGEPVVEPTLTVTTTSLTVLPEGESKTFELSTNKSWTVTSNQEWAVVTPANGEAAENVTITVAVAANETGEARTATLTVKAETLTKTVAVSQEPVVTPEPEQPTPGGDDTATQYQRSTDPVMFADGIQDGKYYVLYNKYYTSELWTEASGKLTMTENESTIYGPTYVFQYKQDNSQLNTTFDSYANFSAGAWKSMSTGKYLDGDLNLNAELSGALYFEYANNWGGTNASNEINVMDVYKCPVVANATLTLWYHNGELVFGDNGYAYEGGTGTNKRKWVVYEVSPIAQ